MSPSLLNKSFNRNGKQSNVLTNGNAMYDKETNPFKRNNYVNNAVCGTPTKIPSTKFQRHNSNPTPETMSIIKTPQDTWKKTERSRDQNSFGKFLKFSRSLSGKKKNAVHEQNTRQSINKHENVVEDVVPHKASINATTDRVSMECDDAVKEDAVNQCMDVVDTVERIPERKNCDSETENIKSKVNSPKNWGPRIFFAEKPFVDVNLYPISCQPEKIRSRRSVLMNTVALPMHFSSGHFRKSPVTLRECCPRDAQSVRIAEEAIARDYDILNKVKHSNIITLMASNFNHWKSLECMTLVMESFDYTLNYRLHQMNSTPPIVQSISIVQQIAGAVLYLQECGYIHSNISSHNVLVRENPWCVKLSSFELTTEVDFAATRTELTTVHSRRCDNTPKYDAVDDENTPLKNRYRQMSKRPILNCSPNAQHQHVSKHRAYDINYRGHLSLYNYQAPELLTTKSQFVFPTKGADVYSLCLLLWEMLNDCVPFVVYNKLEMENMIETKTLSLPFFEQERCQPFMDIFRAGLAFTPEDRTIGVEQLVSMLEEVNINVLADMKKPGTDQQQQAPCSDMQKEANMCVNMTTGSHAINESLLTCSVLSANSADFNKHLHQNDCTSTKKKLRKTPQMSCKKKCFRQLFMNSEEAVDNGSSASLLSHSQLNKRIDEIRRDQSKDDCESDFNLIVAALSSTENEVSFKLIDEKPGIRDNDFSGIAESDKITPPIFGDKMHGSNSFDTSTSKSRGQPILYNIASPETDPCPNVGQRSLTSNTPTACKNKLQRSAWLSNKRSKLSINDIDDTAPNEDNRSVVLNNSNQLNFNIIIEHDRATPKKCNNPTVMSRIKFFDSNAKVSTTTTRRTSNTEIGKIRRAEDNDSNYAKNYPIKDSSFKELIELDQVGANTEDVHTLQSKCRIVSDNSGNPLKTTIFSPCKEANHAAENITMKTSRWPSVRDRILQFENHCESTTKKPSSALTVATEFVRNISKHINGNQLKDVRSKTPMSIESPVQSGVNSDKPINRINLAGAKVTVEVPTNESQTGKGTSDLKDARRPKTVGVIGANHVSRCSQIELLDSAAEVTARSSHGQSDDCEGLTKMSPHEFRTTTSESVADGSLDVTNITYHSISSSVVDSQGTARKRCLLRLKHQINKKTNSIEDMYIDDDFDQKFGLGANIELQSDNSDFINFDISSSS